MKVGRRGGISNRLIEYYEHVGSLGLGIHPLSTDWDMSSDIMTDQKDVDLAYGNDVCGMCHT
jgi:hypothetical protein